MYFDSFERLEPGHYAFNRYYNQRMPGVAASVTDGEPLAGECGYDYSDDAKTTEPSACDFTQSFDVLIGVDRIKFTVHHDQIVGRSDFFKKARSAHWLSDRPETQTTMEDIDVGDFQAYLRVAYSDSINLEDGPMKRWIKAGKPEEEWPKVEESFLSQFEKAVRLYVFADRVLDPKAADVVMDEVVRLSQHPRRVPLSAAICAFAYEHTTDESHLRMFIRDLIIYRMDSDRLDAEFLGALPTKLLRDVVHHDACIKERASREASTVRSTYDRGLTQLGRCRYHQHRATELSPRCEDDEENESSSSDGITVL